jgi:hypothetical protein
MLDVVADTSVVFGWFHEEGEEDVAASRALLRRRPAVNLRKVWRWGYPSEQMP